MFAEIRNSESQIFKLYSLERFGDGSGYSAKIDFVSGNLACIGKELYFDDLQKFIADLKNGYDILEGVASLSYRYEKDNVTFTFIPRGHVVISCLFHEYGTRDQHMELNFEVEQSYLPEFIHSLSRISETIDS